MLINIITQNAVQALVELTERSQHGIMLIGALHMRFATLGLQPSEDETIPLVRPCVEGKQAAIYFLDDGDIVIIWYGAQKAILEKLTEAIQQSYHIENPGTLFSYYDIQAHGESFLSAMKQKIPDGIANNTPATSQPVKPTEQPEKFNPALTVTDKDILSFHNEAPRRYSRIRPEILIVEDQDFSRKILVTALSNHYKVYEAADAETALTLYLRYAPDIVLLDIELPGMDGHQLARLLNKIDPQSYVIMVTGNHELDDIQQAKNNSAKGFIVKPFNKQRIFDAIQKFQQSRK